MDHTPKIEDESVIARRQFAQAADQVNGHLLDNSVNLSSGRSCLRPVTLMTVRKIYYRHT
jgi:hypothetical protein